MISATELAAQDPLAGFRDRFVHNSSEPGLIYLDGNSLGRQPLAVADVVARVVDREWGDRLIRGWNEGWLEIADGVGDLIGEVLGARPGEVTLAEHTSVCLYKAVVAALRERSPRQKVLTDDANFPSDIQILRSACRSAQGGPSNWSWIETKCFVPQARRLALGSKSRWVFPTMGN